GERGGRGPGCGAGFSRRHAGDARRLDGGPVARLRRLLAHHHGPPGHAHLGRHRPLAQPLGRGARCGRGARAAPGAQGGDGERAEEGRHALATAHRAAAAAAREKRARRARAPGPAVRSAEGERAAASEAAGRSGAARAAIIRSRAYDEMHSPLALALGKDIGGQPVVADLSRMPHLLIAGTTGSGKSVALNAMVLSLLYKSTAEHVRLIMIDPKMLELSVYE